MKTVLFTWNPNRYAFEESAEHRAKLAEGQTVEYRWSSGNNRSIEPGDRFFFLRQGEEPRGIMGAGRVVSDVFEDEDWETPGRRKHYNRIAFDSLLDPDTDPILTFPELLSLYPVSGIWNTPSSGISIPNDVAAQVEERWLRVLKRVDVTPATANTTTAEEPQVAAERQRMLAKVILRPQQAAFRAALVRRYGEGCQISGCPVMSVVQACHLDRVAENGSDQPDNGILLRIDLHVLFDADLIGIDPDTLRVQVHPSLCNTEYGELDGVELRVMERPNHDTLIRRWQSYRTRTRTEQNLDL